MVVPPAAINASLAALLIVRHCSSNAPCRPKAWKENTAGTIGIGMCEAAGDFARDFCRVEDRPLRRRLDRVMERLEPLPSDRRLERIHDESGGRQKFARIRHADERVPPPARGAGVVRLAWIENATVRGVEAGLRYRPDGARGGDKRGEPQSRAWMGFGCKRIQACEMMTGVPSDPMNIRSGFGAASEMTLLAGDITGRRGVGKWAPLGTDLSEFAGATRAMWFRFRVESRNREQ